MGCHRKPEPVGFVGHHLHQIHRQEFIEHRRLDIPKSIRERVNTRFLASDMVWQFIWECCVFGPELSVTSQNLFSAYSYWARMVAELKSPLGRYNFYERLETHPELLNNGVTKKQLWVAGERPLLDLSSGYVQRSMEEFPKQGSRKPWLLYQNYLLDLLTLKYGAVDDSAMEFSSPAA